MIGTRFWLVRYSGRQAAPEARRSGHHRHGLGTGLEGRMYDPTVTEQRDYAGQADEEDRFAEPARNGARQAVTAPEQTVFVVSSTVAIIAPLEVLKEFFGDPKFFSIVDAFICVSWILHANTFTIEVSAKSHC